jgi:4-amino-4-deoxy-L-arabinose transferase-like glycosyltransferase
MTPFRLLTMAVFVAAIVPRLAHRGMFVDGITYASIARNLAEGRGQFWTPAYTATIYPEFHDHPPLGLWLQSLWFRLLGDHLFVERAYSLTAATVTGLLIALIWRRLNDQTNARQYEWLSILCWVAMPVVSWSIVGNLLETTVAAFTTGAVAAVVYAGFAGSVTSAIAWGALSGVCVVAATLTKGPIGLFPLAAPIVLAPLASSTSSTGRRWICLTAQWSVVMACGAALLGSDAARASLEQYVNQQVLAAIGGRREVSASSLTILKELLQGVVLPLGLVTGIVVAAARRFVPPSPAQRQQATWLLGLGVAGTLPILASAKQAGHYLVPALPLYAIAAAGVLVSTVAVVVTRVVTQYRTVITAIAGTVMVVALGAAYLPAAGRDRRRLADLDLIATAVPRGAVIGICPESNGDWGLHAWLERRFLTSLDAAHGREREWFLRTPAARGGCPPAECVAVTDTSRDLVLMRCGRAEPR